jgi:hypothetical protein
LGIARPDEAGFVGERYELGAVVAAELGEHTGDMGLGGERADHEPRGDLGVAEACGDQPQDLALARGECVELNWDRGVSRTLRSAVW